MMRRTFLTGLIATLTALFARFASAYVLPEERESFLVDTADQFYTVKISDVFIPILNEIKIPKYKFWPYQEDLLEFLDIDNRKISVQRADYHLMVDGFRYNPKALSISGVFQKLSDEIRIHKITAFTTKKKLRVIFDMHPMQQEDLPRGYSHLLMAYYYVMECADQVLLLSIDRQTARIIKYRNGPITDRIYSAVGLV